MLQKAHTANLEIKVTPAGPRPQRPRYGVLAGNDLCEQPERKRIANGCTKGAGSRTGKDFACRGYLLLWHNGGRGWCAEDVKRENGDNAKTGLVKKGLRGPFDPP